jgi:hypothetical protein
MAVKKPFQLYLRSRLNKLISLGAAILALLCIVFLRPFAAVPVAAIVLIYAVVTAALFFSGTGAREIVEESDEDRQKEIRGKIGRYAEIRDRIAVLRLGDERMTTAVEYFLQESGAYLEKCRELGSYSPMADERIERALEICQVFLGELDESATGRRYGVPLEGEGPTDPAERFARDIRECGLVIRQRVAEDLVGVTGEQRLSIMKELEGKK